MKSLLLYITCLAQLILMTGCSTRQQRSLPAQKNTAPSSKPNENEMLLGVQARSALQLPPNRHWFDSIYNGYTVDTATANSIRQLWRTKKIDIFFGTWCGDSRREVPRMLKILDNCGIPADKIRLVLVDYRYPLYKASPTHEERGKFIFRVPTFIISDHKESDTYTEMGRIVEYPVTTLEKDMLTILNGEAYTPNYKAGAYLQPMLQNGYLSDTSADLQGLVVKIKPLVKNVAELNSLGSVLQSAQETVKAAMVFRLNALLYPQEPEPWNNLGHTYFRKGEKVKAREYYSKALQIAPDNAFARKMLDSLEVR